MPRPRKPPGLPDPPASKSWAYRSAKSKRENSSSLVALQRILGKEVVSKYSPKKQPGRPLRFTGLHLYSGGKELTSIG
jgi:hypothetical protein